MMRIDIHTRPSTWAAFLSWAVTGFMAFPSRESAIVHGANALLLCLVVILARREGRS